MAAELEGHADNAAAALFGGLVAVSQFDGKWRFIQAPLPPLKVIVVVPDVAISTEQMRSALPESLSTQQAVANAASLVFMLDAMARADFDQMRSASQTSFHQEARLPHIPGSMEALSAGQSAGAAVMLSGAGPGMVALAPDHHSAVAAAIQDAFASVGIESEVYFLASRAQGAIIHPQPTD
jgi:homoserine kinase